MVRETKSSESGYTRRKDFTGAVCTLESLCLRTWRYFEHVDQYDDRTGALYADYCRRDLKKAHTSWAECKNLIVQILNYISD